jgi:hypothetical protein
LTLESIARQVWERILELQSLGAAMDAARLQVELLRADDNHSRMLELLEAGDAMIEEFRQDRGSSDGR